MLDDTIIGVFAVGTIFISHSSKNNDLAVEVRDWLRGEGYAETFLDLDPEHGLSPGHRWQEELRKAGERCSAIVIVLTPDWVESEWCLTEFLVAAQLGKKIFPIMLLPTPFDTLRSELTAHYQIAEASTPETRDDGFNRLRIGLQRAGFDPKHFSWPPEGDLQRKSYRGLEALTELDAAVFFGRDAQITGGLDKLRQMRDGARKHILTIVASSGAGKSSFLRAGLLSRLGRDEENFLVLPTVRPGRDALGGKNGVLASFQLSQRISAADIYAHVDTLRAPVVKRFEEYADAANETYRNDLPTLILPIDQAEELFSADNKTGEEALEFIADCLEASDDILVILTIRSDSLGTLQNYPRLGEALEIFNLPALPPENFKDVIEGPGKISDPPITVEPSLTARLIQDLNDADALPLLAFTLERLVEDYGDDHLLELHEYTDGLGGVAGAINSAVEKAFLLAQNDPELPNTRYELDTLARSAFIPWLVQLDESDSSPKRRITPLSLIPVSSRRFIRHFVDARLLTVSEIDGEIMVEVSHEAVLRHWRGLGAWIGEERFMLERLQGVQRAAAQWASSNAEDGLNAQGFVGRDEFLVHRGERLDRAEELLEREDLSKLIDLTGKNYLNECRRAQSNAEQRERNQKRRSKFWRRTFTFGSALAAFIIAVSLVIGERNLQIAYKAALENEARLAMKSNQYNLATKLSILAGKNSFLSPAAKGSNLTLGLASRFRMPQQILTDENQKVYFDSYTGPGDPNVSFFFVTGLSDGSITIWQPKGVEEWNKSTLSTGVAISELKLSPDGSRILVASASGKIVVLTRETDGTWDQVEIPTKRTRTVDSSISWNANFISLGYNDGSIEVWSYVSSDDRWHLKHEVVSENASVLSVALSPNADYLVAGFDDSSIRMWQNGVDSGWVEQSIVSKHRSWITTIDYAPDRHAFVSSSLDGLSILWELNETGTWNNKVLSKHSREAVGAGFNSAGDSYLTVSLDGNARVVGTRGADLQSSTLIPDNKLLITDGFFVGSGEYERVILVTNDGAVWIYHRTIAGNWNLRSTLVGHDGAVTGLALKSDPRRLITAGEDGTVRVWANNRFWNSQDFNTPDSLTRVELSRTGKRILVLDGNGYLQILTKAKNYFERERLSRIANFEHAKFAGSDNLILTAHDDHSLRLWKLVSAEDRWEEVTRLEGHSAPIVFIDYQTSESDRIVSTSSDGTVIIWSEISDGTWSKYVLEQKFADHLHVEFSGDGSRFLIASSPKSAHVWRRSKTGDWEEETVFDNLSSGLDLARFSPSGKSIVLEFDDGTVELWSNESGSTWTKSEEQFGNSRTNFFRLDFNEDNLILGAIDAPTRIWTKNNDDTWSATTLTSESLITGLVLSEDSNLVVTGNIGGKVKLWYRTFSNAWSGLNLEPLDGGVMLLDISEDNSTLVALSLFGSLRIWDLNRSISQRAADSTTAEFGSANSQLLIDDLCESNQFNEVFGVAQSSRSQKKSQLLSEISEFDLAKVPTLRAMGYRQGDNVCSMSKVGGIDRFLTELIPASWWSKI